MLKKLPNLLKKLQKNLNKSYNTKNITNSNSNLNKDNNVENENSSSKNYSSDNESLINSPRNKLSNNTNNFEQNGKSDFQINFNEIETFENNSNYSNNKNDDFFSLYKIDSDKLIIKRLIDFSAIVCVIFVLLFLISSYLQNRILILQNNLEKNTQKISSLSTVESMYVSIAESVILYKNIKNNSTKIYDKLNSITQPIPVGVTVKNIKVDHSEFEISLQSDNLLEFTFLINEYLNNKFISTIYLENLSLESSFSINNNLYTFNLRGIFK